MLKNIPLEKIKPNQWNCNHLSKPEREKLKDQMKANPQTIQPIMVRRLDGNTYEIVDGEQRWRIAQNLGWSTIPAVILENLPDKDAILLTLSYNKLRGNIDWLKLYNLKKSGIVTEDLLEKILSKDEIKKLERIEKISEEAKKKISESAETYGWSKITVEHLSALADYPKPRQPETVEYIVKEDLSATDLKRQLEREEQQKKLREFEKKAEAEKEAKKKEEEGKEKEKKTVETTLTPIKQKYECKKCKHPFTVSYERGRKELTVELNFPSKISQYVEKVNFRDEVMFLECPSCGLELKIEYGNRRALYFEKFAEGGEKVYKHLNELTGTYVTSCPFCNEEHVISSSSKKEEVICSCGSKGKVDFSKEKVDWIKR